MHWPQITYLSYTSLALLLILFSTSREGKYGQFLASLAVIAGEVFILYKGHFFGQ